MRACTSERKLKGHDPIVTDAEWEGGGGCIVDLAR